MQTVFHTGHVQRPAARRIGRLPDIKTGFLFAVGLLCLLAGCGVLGAGPDPGGLTAADQRPWPEPMNPQPDESLLKPGLSVVYFNKKIRHLRDMPDPQAMTANGYAGDPIPIIAHRFGTGNVFDSGMNRGICVQMAGMVRFAKTGRYVLKANANDGIRVFIDGRKILDDPDVHGDRFTAPAAVPISEPGWYALMVRYFQRKGTATLELYWQEPDAQKMVIVPAAAYAHGPASL